jgi:hypothetical protein
MVTVSVQYSHADYAALASQWQLKVWSWGLIRPRMRGTVRDMVRLSADVFSPRSPNGALRRQIRARETLFRRPSRPARKQAVP